LEEGRSADAAKLMVVEVGQEEHKNHGYPEVQGDVGLKVEEGRKVVLQLVVQLRELREMLGHCQD